MEIESSVDFIACDITIFQYNTYHNSYRIRMEERVEVQIKISHPQFQQRIYRIYSSIQSQPDQ